MNKPSADLIIDRMALRSSLKRWRLLTLLLVIIVVIVAFGRITGKSLDGSVVVGPYIAHIAIEGMITEQPTLIQKLEAIAKDKRIKALIVSINSPGGTLVGGETLYEQLRLVNKQKPVVATLGSVAASGGYMVAVASEYIIARQGSLTGSIGVMMQIPEVSGLAEKIGVSVTAVKSSPLKGVPSPFEPLSKDGRRVMQSTIDDGYNIFVEMVAEGRKMEVEEVKKLADGRIYTGRQALSLGLVDQLGGEKEAKAYLKTAHDIDEKLDIKTIKLTPSERLFPFSITGWLFPKKPLTGLLTLYR